MKILLFCASFIFLQFASCKTVQKNSKPQSASTSKSSSISTCGNLILEENEQCDEGPNSTLCSASCKWTQCNLDSTHHYLEDEFPLSFCVSKIEGAIKNDPTCKTHDASTICFDCRGRQTPCERLDKSYQYALNWIPPSSDKTMYSNLNTYASESVALNLSEDSPEKTCASFAYRKYLDADRDLNDVAISGYRFGYAINQVQRLKNPDDLSSWCTPPPVVNCAKWDDAPGVWRAPLGCKCYAKGSGRNYSNCNNVDLYACPWASGSGCGLYFAKKLGGGTHCSIGPEPMMYPHYNLCHFDIPGTMHDACCAKNWYDNPSFQFKGNNITSYECNGCGGSQNKTHCPKDASGINITSPRNKQFPCLGEWDMAVAHNSFSGDTMYQWFRTVDTEQRFTAKEVSENNGAAPLLELAEPKTAKSKLAEKGQVLLRSDKIFDTMENGKISAFCQSGLMHAEKDNRNFYYFICD